MIRAERTLRAGRALVYLAWLLLLASACRAREKSALDAGPPAASNAGPAASSAPGPPAVPDPGPASASNEGRPPSRHMGNRMRPGAVWSRVEAAERAVLAGNSAPPFVKYVT